ncbi:MAG TPA: S53 family peptidase [Ktedonobacteraceae bacterium]
MSTYQVRMSAHRHLFSLLLILMLCCLSLLSLFTLAARNTPHQIGALSSQGHWARWVGRQAPGYADCEAAFSVPCYTPQLYRNAYDLTSILNNGYTGKGQTIVIIDSFGSPTAYSDLKQFDKDYGLPDPPSFQQLAPIGTAPFDPNSSDQAGWAEETSLDIQWSHAMAPDANIVVLTSPVSETEGVQGMPQFLQLEQYAVDHHLGKIISQSWAATENSLFTSGGQQVFDSFNNFYREASFQGVTVFGSTGDSGTANVDVNNTIYPFPTVNFPASSPWITAVGGTSLFADANGNYQKETVWNDGANDATGGGISQKFAEPFYQLGLPKRTQALLNHHRGLPDISINADPNTPVPVYLGFLSQFSATAGGGAGTNGYYLFGGTSEGSPVWSGITADLDQYLGHPVGFLNPIVYTLNLSKSTYGQDFHDITVGNNSQLTNTPAVPGYSAGPGWDPATGLGSPIVQPLFHTLKYGLP